MGLFDRQIEALRKITTSDLINDSVKQVEQDALKMNTEEQLEGRGVKNTNQKITPRYAASTIKAKRRKGQPTNRVTLKDRGVFHANWRIDYRTDEIVFTSGDVELGRGVSLKQILINMYGNEFYGLIDKNVDRLTNMIKPIIQIRLEGIF